LKTPTQDRDQSGHDRRIKSIKQHLKKNKPSPEQLLDILKVLDSEDPIKHVRKRRRKAKPVPQRPSPDNSNLNCQKINDSLNTVLQLVDSFEAPQQAFLTTPMPDENIAVNPFAPDLTPEIWQPFDQSILAEYF
jgi:hypothetical protein